VSIESDAQKDLALSAEDADDVVGGKATKRSNRSAAEPLLVKQAKAFGPTEVSANSGDDDCAPENGGAGD
jgi:hypothetical protein